jgi:hypothetical protein
LKPIWNVQVGGRLGGVFDEDPRRWRMIAVGFASVGLALEIATTAFPSSFIVLAGLGNFSKAVGRGLSQPSFRIIQTHFALANNVGDISAKEEVIKIHEKKSVLPVRPRNRTLKLLGSIKA